MSLNTDKLNGIAKPPFASAHGSVATRTIADSIAEYKATRGTAAVKLLHHVLGKLIGLKCNHCGKEVSVSIESPPNVKLTNPAAE